MAVNAQAAESRTTTVCIDSYRNGIPIGRFYNPFLAEWRPFHSLTHFLTEMEAALDTINFPKAYTTPRAFVPSIPEQRNACRDTDLQLGSEATFIIRIMFRQNSSWQGTVVWLEGRQEQRFRSVLELILLMDNALGCQQVS